MSVQANHLYVHVPFCTRRCVYCDFSIAVRSRVPVDEYLQALESEWRARHSESRFDLETLYFGGGTPSKLGGAGVQRLADTVLGGAHATLRSDAEVTLEANPEDVSAEAVKAWKSAGVNRVSLGVQSFDDAVLMWMRRTHDGKTAHRAVRVLREGGIANISIDLIFAVPSTVPRAWEKDLETALELDLPHVSVYGLTIEPHTPLGRWVARRDVAEAADEIFEVEFLQAHHAFTGQAYDHYEVSNYGKRDLHSRHNWAYWRRKPYGGLGPSAHEFDGAERRWNTSAYTEWLNRMSRGQDPTQGKEELDTEQKTAEEVYLSLRTSMGVQASGLEGQLVNRLVSAGWAELSSDSTLKLTSSGWLRLDSIASDLTLLRSR